MMTASEARRYARSVGLKAERDLMEKMLKAIESKIRDVTIKGGYWCDYQGFRFDQENLDQVQVEVIRSLEELGYAVAHIELDDNYALRISWDIGE